MLAAVQKDMEIAMLRCCDVVMLRWWDGGMLLGDKHSTHLGARQEVDVSASSISYPTI